MEKKQVLYITISVGLALTLFIVGAIWLLSSKKQGTSSLAALQGGTATTVGPTVQTGDSAPIGQEQGTSDKAINPTEWVKNPQSVQGIQTPPPGTPASRGDIIIVYGDNTVTSKTSGALPPAASDPNGVVIQVPQPQASGPTPTGTAPTGTNRVINQTVETQTTAGSAGGAAASVQINQTKTVTSVPAKPNTGTIGPQTAAKPSTPKTYTDYWVQTGAYSTKMRAENAQEQLKAKGITSVVDVKVINGKTYYRVRIGPYTTQKEAQYWLSLIKNIDGFAESYVSSVQTKR